MSSRAWKTCRHQFEPIDLRMVGETVSLPSE